MSDESIMGLLLRAHAKLSAQAHGEQYVFSNISSSQCYEQAAMSVEGAIKSLNFAEQYVARQDAEKTRIERKPKP